MLFDPERHEPLAAARWDEASVRAWVERLAIDALRAFSPKDWWPIHPRDADDDEPTQPSTTLYGGAAGMIWALDNLARRGAAEQTLDFVPMMSELAARNSAIVETWGHGVEGLLMGRTGILLLHYRMLDDGAERDAIADAIAVSVAANAAHPSLELLWGSPSTMHVALTMHERTGDARWARLFLADAAALWRAFLPVDQGRFRTWTQDMYGRMTTYVGAGHGFAGNASALIRGRALLPKDTWTQWSEEIVRTTLATMLHEGPPANGPLANGSLAAGSLAAGSLANWPPQTTPERTPDKRLVQWCHGAPGIVTSLAGLRDPRLDDPLVAAGELTWVAGPLSKGAGLCHGTAGNGHAFLKLFKRTGDELWLDRARAFAMHALAQSDRMAKEHGQRRYSLWTGDPGVACYLWSCIEGDDALPHFDPST